MSADTATAGIRPFLFDRDFDVTDEAAELAKLKEAEEAEAQAESNEEEFEEEIVPTFSEEELARARAEAFEEGRKKGSEEAMASIERETLDVIKALSQHMTELFSAQETANNTLLRDGVGIATAMMRKLFPEMNRQNALGEVRRLAESTLHRLIEEPRIIVRIHPDMEPQLADLVSDLKAGAGYEGRLLLKEDPKLEYGDCRLEWGDGSAERTADHLWQSIDQIIEENMGGGEPAAEQGVDVKTGVTRPAEENPESGESVKLDDDSQDAEADTTSEQTAEPGAEAPDQTTS